MDNNNYEDTGNTVMIGHAQIHTDGINFSMTPYAELWVRRSSLGWHEYSHDFVCSYVAKDPLFSVNIRYWYGNLFISLKKRLVTHRIREVVDIYMNWDRIDVFASIPAMILIV